MLCYIGIEQMCCRVYENSWMCRLKIHIRGVNINMTLSYAFRGGLRHRRHSYLRGMHTNSWKIHRDREGWMKECITPYHGLLSYTPEWITLNFKRPWLRVEPQQNTSKGSIPIVSELSLDQIRSDTTPFAQSFITRKRSTIDCIIRWD